jgi:hypothetical protein
MDDQRIDRTGGDLAPQFRISLGRLFGALFWTCVFLGSLSWTWSYAARMTSFEDGVDAMRADKTSSLTHAIIYALIIASPILALVSLFGGSGEPRGKRKK